MSWTSSRADRQGERKAEYKRTVGADDLRRRRDTNLNQLRKGKRDDSLQKRRQLSAALSGADVGGDGAASSTASSALTAAAAATTMRAASTSSADGASLTLWSEADWSAVCEALMSSDGDAVRAAAKQLRIALTVASEAPPVDEVLRRQLVPRLVECLGAADDAELVFEAAWVLTNIASDTAAATYAVVDAGVLPECVRIMSSIDAADQIRDMCVWIVGNVAGEDAVLRDVCFRENVLLALTSMLVEDDPSVELLRSVVWALSNLCRGQPTPDFAFVGPLVPLLAHLLRGDDLAIKIDALWAFVYLLEHCDDAMRQAIVDSGVCVTLARLLAIADSKLVLPAVRATGSIVSGTTEQTDAMLQAAPFEALARLLDSSNKRLVMDVLWVLSNFTAGEEHQIQAVIDVGVMPKVAGVMLEEAYQLRREACYVLANAIVGGSVDQVLDIVDEDIIAALVCVGKIDDAHLQQLSLDALMRILEVGKESVGPGEDDVLQELFVEAGGLDLLNDLFHAKDPVVCSTVDKIISEYFDY